MKKKILFVTGRPVNNENAGGILFDKIVRSYGIENFCFLSVENKIDPKNIPLEYLDKPFQQFAFRLPNVGVFWKVIKRLPLIEPIYVFLKYHLLKSKIISFAKKQNCELIFSPLRGDVLFLLEDLLIALKLPLIGIIEDTVEREVTDNRLLYKRKMKSYYHLIPKTETIIVAGETMQEYIKDSFNIDSIILRLPFQKKAEIEHKTITDTINIFFGGNLYADQEMLAFLKAVDLIAEKNSSLNIAIFSATHRPLKYKPKNYLINNLGWLSHEVLSNYMEKCHVAYLPYKSEIKFMHSMKYAFPSKAGLYTSKNLPVFFHGPSYSSFNTFLKIYKVGVSCDSFESEKLVKVFESLIQDSNLYIDCQMECKRAFENEFSEDCFNKRVNEIFNNS